MESVRKRNGGNNPLLAAALAYAARGWRVLPLHFVVKGKCSCGDDQCGNRAGKHPFGKLVPHGEKDATTDRDTIIRWWESEPKCNLGIATGPESGIWVLGPDGQEGLNDLANLCRVHMPEAANKPVNVHVHSGSGGGHLYFKWPEDGRPITNHQNHRGTKIDVRGADGLIVAPPSRNGKGPYRWHQDEGRLIRLPHSTPDVCTTSVVVEAPPWLLAWVRGEDGQVSEAHKARPKKLKLKVAPDGRPDARARAIAYLARCPEAISGQGGHIATMNAARGICWGFDLGEEAGFELLRDHYNPRCQPPWSETELWHKAREADTKPFDKPRGFLLAENEPPPPGHPGPGQAQAEAPADDADGIENIPLPEAPPWPVMAPEALHGLIGEIVQAVEPNTEADPVAILGQLLAAVGNCIGRGPHFLVEGTKHHTNLSLMTVGKTSAARKGTAWDRVAQVMAIADPEWASQRVAGGLSSGEGLIFHVRDAVTKPNAKGEIEIVDGGVDDKRLLALETEFAQVLRILKREGNSLSTLIRQCWDRGNLATLTRNNPLKATDAHVSICGHITIEDLTEYLGKTELFNGFANRLVWLMVRRSKILPDGGEALDLSPLGLQLAFRIAQARNIGQVRRDRMARGLWHEVYPRLTEDRRGLYGAATSRAEAQVLRLSMLYALVDGQAEIAEAHLRAALAFWAYAEESAKLIFGAEVPDPLVEMVYAKLAEAGRAGLSRTGLHNAFGRNIPATKLVDALAKLRDQKRARSERVPSTGCKPREIWRANTTNEFTNLRSSTGVVV